MMTGNQRSERRYDRRIPVLVQGTNNEDLFFAELVLTKNISSRGACLELENKVPLGQKLKIFFRNGRYQAIASVRWQRNVGERSHVGIQLEHEAKSWKLLIDQLVDGA
ncbi:MAG: PilZ domain-containing protein [Acidobacteriota bacterium]|nr:PilZ domain-containing protein [Blastocatellia bacterium]MDW8413332.1 PilZ domain-containing protein [Acidobacteriota bacterium]